MVKAAPWFELNPKRGKNSIFLNIDNRTANLVTLYVKCNFSRSHTTVVFMTAQQYIVIYIMYYNMRMRPIVYL